MTVCLKVYLLDSTLAFDMLYTYLADEEAPGEGGRIRRGMFVVVPFGNGNSSREAIVWDVEGAAGAADTAEAAGDLTGDAGNIYRGSEKKIKLKKILKVYDDEPLSEAELSLCEGLCALYACTPGAAIRCIRPLRAKKKASSRQVETVRLNIPAEEARRLVSETKLKSIYQIKILEELAGGAQGGSGEAGSSGGPESSGEPGANGVPGGSGEPESSDGSYAADTDGLLLKTGASRAHLKALEKKGYISFAFREAESADLGGAAGTGQLLSTYPEHTLNPGQQQAYEAVRESIDSGANDAFLLHGITGSGKTEVYMHLISHVLAGGGDVIMMVPEIALTPQMIAHFTSRFGDNVAVWHSALTEARREREWYRMSRGLARISVCTRSGVFSPLRNVRLVIMDEAHDGSYRSEETGLRYNACEVAELRFGGSATVLYGSATPDVTMYYRAAEGKLRLLRLAERAGAGTVPEMRIVDMRDERSTLAQGGLFSDELKTALQENYAAGKQAMLFVGRRGYSSRMFCRDCGRTMICGACGLPMTYHRTARRLLCNYCGKTAPAPVNCPACRSTVLGFGSPGTERVEKEVKQLFPDAEVLRMDSDTVKGRDGHGALLRRFQKEKIPFLVGTQMITKGHDFPGVTLVGIIDADGQINQPEYDAGEKAYQVIAQVAGRAGRGEDPGKVLIQTYSIDDPSIGAAVNGDYHEFYEKELAFRRTMLYPPFCSLCNIKVTGKDDRAVYDYLRELAAAMRSGADAPDGKLLILGPSREPVPKIGDRYRWRLTVKAPDRSQIIALFLRQYVKIKPGGDMRLATVFEN